MSININKKAICIIIVVIILIVIGGIVANLIIKNVEVNSVKKKLSAIKSEELKENLEKELKETDLFLEMNLDNLYVGSMINFFFEFDCYTCLSNLAFKGNANNIVGAIEIPCFKITSDSNGNFKNIEYTDILFNETQVIKEVVEKVFKNNYGIDMNQINKNMENKFYKEESYQYTNEGEIYTLDNNFFIAVLHNITGMELEYGDNVTDDMREYKTKTFGVEF